MMTSCTMRTRWLHSPFRTAGISTALFAVVQAIVHVWLQRGGFEPRLPPGVLKEG
jgi:hypothetical protein